MPAKRPEKKAPKPAASPGRAPNTFCTSAKPAIGQLIRRLHELYPDADCELLYRNPFELLVATILSAQSTDKMVNKVTPPLFRKYRNARDLARADPEALGVEIRSTGFYRNKAKNIIGAAKRLVEAYDGEVPAAMDELVTLPGVARKTANVVLGTAFGEATGVVVDTHVRRLAHRLGLSSEKNPDKVEQDLIRALPENEWVYLGHALIWHGRRVCHAKKPRCSECTLSDLCPQNGVETPH